jgi:hypothetical protein
MPTLDSYAECRYSGCAGRRNEVRTDECHLAECRYGECRGAVDNAAIGPENILLLGFGPNCLKYVFSKLCLLLKGFALQ